MGKIRSSKEVKKKATGSRNNELQLRNMVGKLESDISAISLGPPRSKILKKSASSSPGSGLLTTNFASRAQLLNKQKKKVRFCQNLVAEELKEQKTSSTSEDAIHYFKVIHPSAIERKGIAGVKSAGIPKSSTARILDKIDSEVLLSNSSRALRKIIKSATNNKKSIGKAKRQLFKKKMELLKTKKIEAEKSKQRQQTVIVGDMHPMLQALPPLTSNDDEETDLLAEKVTEEDKAKIIPIKNKFSVKKRQQAILDSLNFFEASGVTTGLSSKT